MLDRKRPVRSLTAVFSYAAGRTKFSIDAPSYFHKNEPANLVRTLAAFRMEAMKHRRCLLNRFACLLVTLALWLACVPSASAQDAPLLIAQTGMAKTAIGYLLVLLGILLGMLVVCRPSWRKPAEGDERRR